MWELTDLISLPTNICWLSDYGHDSAVSLFTSLLGSWLHSFPIHSKGRLESRLIRSPLKDSVFADVECHRHLILVLTTCRWLGVDFCHYKQHLHKDRKAYAPSRIQRLWCVVLHAEVPLPQARGEPVHVWGSVTTESFIQTWYSVFMHVGTNKKKKRKTGLIGSFNSSPGPRG